MFYEFRRDDYLISTNPDLLNIDVLYNFLTTSYWRQGVPRDLVIKAICNSLCFGLYGPLGQFGFARVISDYTHFAYLMDVFVLEPYRGQGLGRWLVDCVITCLERQGIGCIRLATRDAHELYRRCGFKELARPEDLMERLVEQPWFKPQDEV